MKLQEKFLIDGGFQSTQKEEILTYFGDFENTTIYHQIENHERSKGRIVSGVFQHEEDRSIILIVSSSNTILIAKLNTSAKLGNEVFSHSLVFDVNLFSSHMSFIQETILRFVNLHQSL